MGLIRYVANLEEILDGLTIPDGKIEDNQQRSKGLYIDCVEEVDVDLNIKSPTKTEVIWKPYLDIEITGVKLGVSNEYYDVLPYETSWNNDVVDLYIGEELVFEHVRVKDIYQYTNFRVYTDVEKGTEIKIVYHNQDGKNKKVWLDIDYLAPPFLCKVKVICKDVDDNILKEDIYECCIENHTFVAPEIDRYIHIDPTYFQIVEVLESNVEIEKEIAFLYINEQDW